MTLPSWVLEHLEGLPDKFTGQIILNCNLGGITGIRVSEDLQEKEQKKCSTPLTNQKL